nr:PREDICTED: F-box/LRR-repeat protein 25-like [Daucus carota subsp. sativus]
MGGQAQKKARSLPQEFGDEDRISRLPDELIHKILSFVDAKEAVQTSVLSRRWELIWTTLPFLSFCGYEAVASRNVCKFMRHFLSNRNHQSKISDLNLCVKNKGFTKALVDKYVKYAISHNLKLDKGTYIKSEVGRIEFFKLLALVFTFFNNSPPQVS